MVDERKGGRPEADVALRRRISERLDEVRGKETHKEFAARIGLSSEKQVGRYLRAESSPSIENLVLIAEKTESSVDYLVGKSDERTLEPDDEVAGQLWHRVMKQAMDEGAQKVDAEKVIPPPTELLEEVLDFYSGRGRCTSPISVPAGATKYLAESVRNGRDLMASHVDVCDHYIEGIRMHKAQYRRVLKSVERQLAE